eukprot:1566665-Rhodomonas_salina.1
MPRTNGTEIDNSQRNQDNPATDSTETRLDRLLLRARGRGERAGSESEWKGASACEQERPNPVQSDLRSDRFSTHAKSVAPKKVNTSNVLVFKKPRAGSSTRGVECWGSKKEEDLTWSWSCS